MIEITENKMNNVQHKVGIVNFVLILLCVVVAFVPYCRSNFPKIVHIGLIMLWYIDVFFHLRCFLKHRIVLLTVLWAGYVSFLGVLGFSSVSIGNYYNLFIALDIVCKAIYVGKYYEDDTKKMLMRILQVVFLCTILDNIFIGINDPTIFEEIFSNADRMLDSSVFVTQHYAALAFYVVCNFYIFKKEQNKLFRCLELASVVSSLFFMFSFSPRTNAVIEMFFFLFVLYVYTHRMYLPNVLFVALILILMVASLFLFSSEIAKILPDRIAVRFEALMSLFSGASVAGNMYLSRFTLQVVNIETFLSSPLNFLFGEGWHLGFEYWDKLGQHALLTNYAGYFGCVGIAFLIAYYTTLKKNMLLQEGFDHVYCKASLTTLVFCSLISVPLVSENLVISVFFASLINCLNKHREVLNERV